jgi:hypothetical protein
MDTAAVWPDVRVRYRWGHPAAHILNHQDQPEALTGQRRLGGLLGAMTRPHAAAGTLAPALGHVRPVPRRDWPGRCPCSTGPDLPRTQNELAPFVGAYRSHDRRTTGRQGASPGLGLNGAVWVMAATATRLQTAAADLVPEKVSAWQARRQARETRRQQRTLRRRLRRDPVS